MGTRPRLLGIVLVVSLVAISGGILLTGAVIADGDEKDGTGTNESDTGDTLEDVQVGTLELGNVTVENATIEKLHVGEVRVERGANALAAAGAADRSDGAIELASLAIPTLELGNVSATELAVADEQGAAQTLIDEDAGNVVVRNLSVEAMNVTQITIEDLSVADRAGGASDRTPASDNAQGAPHDKGDQTDADHEVTTRELSDLTVEQVDVEAITIESLALGSVGVGQGPADGPPSHSAADEKKGSSDHDAADEGTAAVEYEGETLSLVTMESITVETATSDAVAVRNVRGGASDGPSDGSHGR